ncbi:phospholipase D-like domain-containing protein [Runella sp. MFBS21]|uniref:phospholipase D-like domain-containing protein n=1 Tax=Runella sp. MFBS21 TaxID=3034018 RepID=UPI0023F766BC|nr:phospholipase D-like domain-containing protein [Runella sp. MFBS21]MDF7821731.1 phospholipase D-like domain-containing protein [Runella sp. MFBS21]
MELSEYAIVMLKDVIIGDSGIHIPYLTGQKITDLFNSFCTKKEIYPKDWDDPENGFRYSRKKYTEKRLQELNGTYQLSKLIEQIVQPVHFIQHKAEYDASVVDAINAIIVHDGYKVIEIEGTFKVVGDVAPDELKIKVHFEDIQNQILEQVNAAKYIIWVAVAWFTDKILMKALHEKQKQGVNVQVVIFDDEINQKYGILKADTVKYFNVHKIKYDDSTKMHNKFCVIDLNTVIHGTYNWTDRARYNDETMQITESRELAHTFADEFIKLKQKAKK